MSGSLLGSNGGPLWTPAFPLWLKMALEYNGITSHDLAAALSVPLAAVRAWLDGDALPSEVMTPRIAQYFEMSPATVRHLCGRL